MERRLDMGQGGVGVVVLVIGLFGAFSATAGPAFADTISPPQVAPDTQMLNSVACPGVTLCVAVGSNSAGEGVVVTISSGSPGAAQVASGTGSLYGVACPTSTSCEAVGSSSSGQGVVVPITNGSPGVAQVVSGTQFLHGVACPSATTCEAVGYVFDQLVGGVVVPITNGSPGAAQVDSGISNGFYGIACPASTTCEAVGGAEEAGAGPQGAVVTVDVASGTLGPAEVASGTAYLLGVACPSTTICEAVGFNSPQSVGVMTPISNGSPGAAQMTSTTGSLQGVECTSTATCEAVGQNGQDGYAAPITNGTLGPGQVVSGASFLGGVACPSATTCDAVGQSPSHQGVVVMITMSVPAATLYHPLAPARIADTRSGSGQPYAGQTLGPGSTLAVQVTGVGGVPAGATAVVLNVTATNSSAVGYFTVYPTGAARPLASSLNFAAGATTPNLVEVGLGSSGQVSVYNYNGSADAVVDVEGYVSPGSGPAGAYNALSPARISDTRTGSGQPNAGQTLGAGGIVPVQVDGVGGVPAGGVSAVVLNVTVTDTTATSYLTAYADGTTRPLASNLNFNPGQTVPNRVIVPVGADGKVDLYNYTGTVDTIVDVSGWFTDGSNPAATGASFVATGPTRLADTRPGSGEPDAGMTLGPGASVTVAVTGTGGVPATASAVVLNVTVTDTTGLSYLTVYPTGQTRPLASDLNWVAGDTRANMAVVRPGTNGTVTVYNYSSSTDVIVDVTGYYQ